MNSPHYPIYIVSRHRADTRLTSKHLEAMNVPYRIIVEQDDYEAYAAVIDANKILVLPELYQENYDSGDDLGRTQSVGSGPARNFAWDQAAKLGAPRHWVVDDNIRGFFRFNRNNYYKVLGGVFFRAMEDFCDRYENIAMAGPNYAMFQPRRVPTKPFVLNTRVYSCNLIQTDLPYRWRCRYNEDTDLSLRILKDGHCTVQFNAFLQMKMPTQTVKGGNTEEIYALGTGPKTAMLVRHHPDVARIVNKFGRIHHSVDYRPFRKNALRRRPSAVVASGVDEYGMKLIFTDMGPAQGGNKPREGHERSQGSPAVSHSDILKVPGSSLPNESSND